VYKLIEAINRKSWPAVISLSTAFGAGLGVLLYSMSTMS
jgi:hypothetical protein